MDIRLGELRHHDRARIAELLVSTRAFSREEVAVALELFDERFADGENAGADDAHVADADYEFIGAYDGDRLLGYACVGPTPATDGTDAFCAPQTSGAAGAVMLTFGVTASNSVLK